MYSIWLCMAPPKKYANTISEYYMEEKNIVGMFTGEENYDLLSVLIIRLCTDESVDCESELMENLQFSLEQACEALGKTVEEFQEAKNIISIGMKTVI